MNATIRFLPSAISPRSVEEPSASTSPALTFWPVVTRGLWWIRVPWLERMNFCSSYSSLLPVEPCTTIWSASTYSTVPAVAAQQHVAGVERRAALHAGADQRGVGLQQRHGLALHVRAHQRAVGVVVLEERDHRGRHRPDLLGRDIHEIDVLGADRHVLAGLRAAQDLRALQPPGLGVHRRVRLGDQQLLFLGGVEPFDLVGHDAVLDDAVGGRHEAVLGDLGERGQRADQADVRSLGGLDRAHAPVVGRVHVAHLDRRALAREPAGAKRGQAPAVGEPRQRVGLVHELGQLGGAEELLQRRHHRADVDDRLRRDRVGVLGRQALAHDALHAVEPDPEGLLDQLADGAQAAVAEVLVLVEVLGDRLARHARWPRPRSP